MTQVDHRDDGSEFPFVVVCGECGEIQRRSELGPALEQARRHDDCEECGGHCGESCRRCLGHCEYPNCRRCGGHCNRPCEDCPTSYGQTYTHCNNWCARCDGGGGHGGGHCESYCEDYCGDHCQYDCPNCENHHPAYDGEDDYDDEYGSSFDSDLVHSYSYKPDPIFHGGGKLFVGLELEVRWGNGNANQWLNDYVRGSNLLYAKYDSSVTNGFELVTHPMSLEWARLNFPYDAMTDAMNHGAIPDDDSCGTHIHISRNGLTGKQWWTVFAIHRKLRGLCGHIGGRGTRSDWASWDSDTILNRPVEAKLKKVGYPYPNRYVPVNIQPTETIELRYPKGDFTANGVKRNLQWIEAMTTFGRDASCGELAQSITTGRLINHINSNDWPELQSCLNTYSTNYR